MTDKVQKIREEIEKIKTVHSSVSLKDSKPDILVVQVCINLLSFIDSMQEESKFKVGDKIRLKGTTVKGDTIIEIYTSEVGNTYFKFKNSGDASADLDWELVEEPKKCMYTKDDFTEEDRKILCEDCEEKCEYAKKEEPVSEELEEAAVEAFKQIVDENRNSFLEIFKAGAEWMHKKMIHEFNLKGE